MRRKNERSAPRRSQTTKKRLQKESRRRYRGPSVDLQVRGRGSVSPFVDLLGDHRAAQRAALLPVEPQGDALVAEYVLRDRKTRQLASMQAESPRLRGFYLTQKSPRFPELSLTDGAHVSGVAALTPSGRRACMLTAQPQRPLHHHRCGPPSSLRDAAEH